MRIPNAWSAARPVSSRTAPSTPSPIPPARFIRVTETNLENIARGRYNQEASTMVVEKRPNFRGAA